MHNPLLIPEIRTMLAESDEAGITEVLSWHPASVAEFTEGLSVDETWKLLDRDDIKDQAEAFSFYPHDKQTAMVSGTGREHMARLIEVMPHDERVHLLKRLNDDVVDQLLPLVAKADREDIRRLLSYPERSAGAVMTTDYSWLPPDVTVAEALTRLRQQALSSETIYYTYVLDADRKLIGFVSLHDLILAKPTASVADVMQKTVISVRADQDQESVARTLAKYDVLALPIVDAEGRLLGIVTHDDMLDVLVEEQTEDQQKMAGVVPLGEDYLNVPFRTIWFKRSVWLSCLFVAEFFTFTALAYFENAIARVVALSLFVPLCISTGGNSGSQAATLITRAMALGFVGPKEWIRVLRHEILMGLALGVTLGAIGFIRGALTPTSILRDADRWLLALVIAQAVAAICLWGTIVGSMLPLIFRRLGFDPGYACSPFVATFVDVTGIVIYFTVASVWLL